MKTRPLVALCAAWVTGSMFAAVLQNGGFGWGMLGLSLIAAALLLFWPDHRRTVLILALTLSCAAVYWHWNDRHNESMIPALLQQSPEQMNEQPVYAEGVITSLPETDGDRVSFRMKLYRLSQSEKAKPQQEQELETVIVQLKLAARQELQHAAAWKRGDRITVRGTWKKPGEARNFDTFDYRQYLRTQYIHWMIKAEGVSTLQPSNIHVTGPASWRWQLLRWNDDTRQMLGSRIGQIFHTEDQGYMKGLLIGDANDIDPQQFASFSRLGLTHILAISGLHVAIYTGILLWLLRKIGLTRERACLVVMLLLPVYVLLTGASPSAIRAGIMGMIALYAASRGMLKDGLHILCAACWGMLLYEPYFLLNISFQLSFVVTAGLILYVPLMQPLLQKLPSRLAGALTVTLVAQMISFPLTIYYFNQFSLLSFAANLVLVPVSSLVVLPVGSIALVISYIWLQAAVWIGSMVSWINIGSFWIMNWLDGLPLMLTIWHSPSLGWILIYYGALYLLLRYGRDLIQGKQEQGGFSTSNAAHSGAAAYRGEEAQATAPLPVKYRNSSRMSGRTNLHGKGLFGTGSVHAMAGGMAGSSHAKSCYVSDVAPKGLLYRIRLEQRWMAVFPERGFLLAALSAVITRVFYFHTVGSPWLRRRLLGIMLAPCLLIVMLIYGYESPLQHGDGMVQYLDVGQGDSILITTPGGKHILVDGGGTMNFEQKGQEWRRRKDPYEIGAKLLVPLLKQRGIHQLDAVILTHGDHDHAGGLLAVAEQIPIRRFIFNGTMPKGSGLDGLMRTLLDRQVPIYGSSPGMKLQPDDQTELAFLSPIAVTSGLNTDNVKETDPAAAALQSSLPYPLASAVNPLPRKEEQNHYSVVFLLTMNSRRFLFTGDADQTEEKGILYELASKQNPQPNPQMQGSQQFSGQSIPMPVDILKIGHHGSKTSTSAEWLQYWQPSLSVISVGQHNTYGHPTAEVLKRIQTAGSDVARTDLNGEVQIRVNADGQLSRRTLLQNDTPSK
ncbi:ComEC/Rec2 family competence protein [Paenibacillus sp. Z6-24]